MWRDGENKIAMRKTQARQIINNAIDKLQSIRDNERLTLRELDAAVIVTTSLSCAVLSLREAEANRMKRVGM